MQKKEAVMTNIMEKDIELEQIPSKTEAQSEFAIAITPNIETVPKPPSPNVDTVKVPLSRTEFILVYIGLLLAILLFGLDQTIVATALRAIVDDLGQQELISWIGSAFLLTAAPLSTLYGKFADIFGRKWVFVSAIFIFELGSFICGISNSMTMLIIGRAVAGIGGGGIFSLVLIIISDIVSLRDRGTYTGIIGASTGLSSVIGPLIGGALSDHGLWRWCFYINLPLGAITLATVIVFLKFPPVEGSIREKINRIDFIGAALLLAAIVCFLTPLQLGGSSWNWNSGQTIGMFVGSAVLFALFVYIELKVANDPIVSARIFVNPSVPLLLIISLVLGAGFLAGIYYISLFFQVVYGDSATNGGVAIIPAVFGLVVLSVVSGIIASKTGKYVQFLRFGPIIMAVGIVLISLFDGSTSIVVRIISLFVFGLGVGALIQINTLALQCSVPHELIAIATGVTQTCNTLGRAIGIAITGTIANNIIVSDQAGDTDLQYFISKFIDSGISVDPTNTLSILALLENSAAYYPNNTAAAAIYNSTLAKATDELINGFTDSFKISYLSLLPYPIVIFILSWFVHQFEMGAKSAEVVIGE
ncbi:hypothetical protein HK100_006984 [Physocladia obscura]|uniref:Major facilitator superfamily (MFS) profile domain-containing protein n=1 Tax=Physocladia obscura TaxID=109957 RepID=A0AAD5T6Q9_9FUNG|nr:hypothetical protein HK100_006984 [Physocladia obscura]